MKKWKIILRVFGEILFFSIPFFWSPVWVQWTAPVLLSLLLEWYLSRRRSKRLRDAVNKIDFTALQQHHFTN